MTSSTTSTLATCTLDDLQPYFTDDNRCFELFTRWRWPGGFVCPRCSSRVASLVRTRGLWECRVCRRQVSLTSGTPLHRTRLPLRTWLYAIWMVARRKQSISALQLQKDLGLGSYETAWALLHKVRRVLHDPRPPLAGPVDVGVLQLVIPTLRRRVPGRSGWTGRARDLLGLVVERLPEDGTERSRAGEIRFYFLGGHRGARQAMLTASPEARVTAAGHLWHGEPPIVRTILANLKAWLDGTFHGVSAKYLPAYLDEFVFRFHHRGDAQSLPSLIAARLLAGPPLPRAGLRAGPPAGEALPCDPCGAAA